MNRRARSTAIAIAPPPHAPGPRPGARRGLVRLAQTAPRGVLLRPALAPAQASVLRAAPALVALAGVLGAGVAIALAAAGQRLYFFVPAEHGGLPGWLRGPLAGWNVHLDARAGAALLVVMFACYVATLALARRIPAPAAIAAIVALHVVVALAPPLFSADVFSYVDYARLGAIHGLNPYSHGAAAAPGDAVRPFVLWHDVPSPYGPLFTLASYALAHLSVAVTLWIYKALAALAGLGCVALVWRLAARRSLDPRRAAMFVGLNPLFVVYGVGGAHNDLVMELIVLGALTSALRGRRQAAAGAQIALAALTKASAAFVAPFMLIGAGRPLRTLAGASAVTAAVAAAAVAVLGEHPFAFVPQLVDQQRMAAHFSVPNQIGLLLGQGGLTEALRIAFTAGFVVAVVWLLVRAWRGADWIACAGWATLAALVTSAWLTPWYAVWLLPLAAIAPGRRLPIATLLFCAFVLATRAAPQLL